MKINNIFLPYHLSIKLKNLGFNETCLAFYYDRVNYVALRHENKEIINEGTLLKEPRFLPENPDDSSYIKRVNIACKSPTYDQAFDWLIKTHNIHGEVHLLAASNIHGKRKKGFEKIYMWHIHNLNEKRWSDGETVSSEFYSNKEAKDDCLEKIFELINQNL